jgi:hypothetical protein
MKIALVKQDVYQDLYVAGRTATPEELLFSSIMRVGPIGLFTRLNADFLIVKEATTPECRAWEHVIPHYPAAWFRELQTRPFAQTSFPEARFLEPGTRASHADFAVACEDVNWGDYDVVISINFSIPTAIIARYPRVLWCYMVGEANVFCDRVHFDYDVCLNQETRGVVAAGQGVIDFPYTFLGPDCLDRLMARVLGRPSTRQGIFAEINSFTERPVRDAGHLRPLESTGHPIRLHRQSIRENLTQLYDTKYFVKIGGRKIRGNSVIEAISSGAVVLMNPSELHHSQFLPSSAWVYTVDDALARIHHLDANPAAYEALRAEQRARLQAFAIDGPLESLQNALREKRLTGPRPKPPVVPAWRRIARDLKHRLTR